MPKILAKFERGHLQQGHQMQVGRLKLTTFDNNWLQLETVLDV